MASNPNTARANVLPQRPHTQQGQPQAPSQTQAPKKKTINPAILPGLVQQYEQRRKHAVEAEAAMGFEHACETKATAAERQANTILQRIKEQDLAVYLPEHAGTRHDPLGQRHDYFYGDHYLSNVGLIQKTRLFQLCHAMPKGAHLHIHFNANLAPNFLLDVAKTMEHMYIWSSEPLTGKAAFDKCRIQFSILGGAQLQAKNPAGRPANLFSSEYKAYPEQAKGCGWMLFRDFMKQFPAAAVGSDVNRWLQNKLVFDVEETHNSLQTAEGAWQNFNMRTQMMKGLFNYEKAYIRYTQACLAEFARDNIQYAEIRPNFMSNNQLWTDDGTGQLDNAAIMRLIISEYKAFQEKHGYKVFKGLKVIYCTPRSFDTDKVKIALDECLDFKLNPDFAKYIAGFDLVGEESKGHPLRYFTKQFLQFQAECAANNVTIPFLFHCGETLDKGTDTDGNLYDALLLGAKRIGHGFALPWHPHVMQKMKENKICVELCPISNEILGLTPRIGGHSAYTLLANNVHCTISTDNSTPFRSTLSHDFYQIMAGKQDMTLWGFRQLIEWSIEHSCLNTKNGEKDKVFREWQALWSEFVNKINQGAFGGLPGGAGRTANPGGGGGGVSQGHPQQQQRPATASGSGTVGRPVTGGGTPAVASSSQSQVNRAATGRVAAAGGGGGGGGGTPATAAASHARQQQAASVGRPAVQAQGGGGGGAGARTGGTAPSASGRQQPGNGGRIIQG